VIKMSTFVAVLTLCGCHSSHGSVSTVSLTATLVSISVGWERTHTLPRHFLLSATGHYDDGGTRDLTTVVAWQSSNPRVVKLSEPALFTTIVDGTTALEATPADSGTVIVTALYQGKIGSVSLTVPVDF
jgi:hypothetical protein